LARALGWLVAIVLASIVAAAAISMPESARRAIPQGVLAVAGAALIAELLKTGIERLRPRTVPLIATGNSFPSGHVMTTTVAALAACALVTTTNWSKRWKRLAYASAAACVIAQAWDRIAMGAHWLSDVPASVLFAIAWFLLTPALVWRPRRLAAGTLAFGLAYGAVYVDPALRLHLPTASAADASGATWALDVAAPGARDLLVGSWMEATEEPLGSVAWCRETSSAIPVDRDVAAGSIVKLMLRPPDCGQRQRRIDMRATVSFGGRDIAVLALRRGWREYRFTVPEGTSLARGDRIELRLESEPGACRTTRDPGLVALRYVKIVPAPPT
jgi:membrane-associated phospholipid phosphatase